MNFPHCVSPLRPFVTSNKNENNFYFRVEDYVPISIPLEAATNAAQVEEWKAKVAEAEAQGKKLGIYKQVVGSNPTKTFFQFFVFFSDQKDLVRPQIPFEACLEAFLETEDVPKFYSTAAKKETFAKKTMR